MQLGVVVDEQRLGIVDADDGLHLTIGLPGLTAGGGLTALLERDLAEQLAPLRRTERNLLLVAALALAAAIAAESSLDLRGLMTIGRLVEDPEDARDCFRSLRELRDRLRDDLDLELPVLSMGMTADLEVAIAEGATRVRVGSAIFGARA